MRHCAAILFFVAVLIAACKLMKKDTDEYVDKPGMDLTTKPGNDFYQYANGTWFRKTRIPADEPGWGGFIVAYENSLSKLKNLLDSLSRGRNEKGSLSQKAGDFFASGMDTATIDKKGYEPLRTVLASINAVNNYSDLLSLLAENSKNGDGDLIGFSVGADEKNSARNIAIFSQTGLTLPEKEYYFKTDSTTQEQRKKLVGYAARLFVLTGIDSAGARRKAEDILKLETAIAASHRTPVELRDPQVNYNKMPVTELQKLCPAIPWRDVFSKMGFTTDSVNVQQPKYYEALGSLLPSQPIDVWKSKVAFDYISSKTAYLSKPFREATFEFDRQFSGQKEEQPRWKTIVEAADNGLKDVVGQLYVQRYFPPEAKQHMTDLVDNLQKAFSNRISRLDWMSDSTKQKAQDKLAKFMKKIGYPSKWKDYGDVAIDAGDYFANNVNIARHDYRESVRKIGNPVDRSEWGMTPPTVNAYYNPTYNEIVFPAGILSPPFFNEDADDAVNYGAIGSVIGHEMTHGFDDQGRQYDAAGNLKDWWTKQEADRFSARAKMITSQYDAYVVLDTLHVNGALTLGENIADMGGIAIAYDAFKLTPQGKGHDVIDGLSPDQRFFLGQAQAWRMKYRPETMRFLINVDEHSPERFRVDGPLSDFGPFYETFDLKDGDKMYRKPEDRVMIW